MQLKDIVAKMEDCGADVAKLAATANSITDTATMLSLLRYKQASCRHFIMTIFILGK